MMNKTKWVEGKQNEIDFWSHWCDTKGDGWKQDYIDRLDPNLPFQEYLICYLPKELEISLLDVGAGPLTSLGKVLTNCKLNITPIDPLADEYNNILTQYNITPIIRTQFGEVECLSKQFSSNSFHLIHVCNALDHSYNPLMGIQQMLDVLKKNCFIYMSHNTNEAEKEGYTGFHQWNFCEENQRFIIWNKNKRIDVNETLRGAAEVRISHCMNSNIVEIRKINQCWISLRRFLTCWR